MDPDQDKVDQSGIIPIPLSLRADDGMTFYSITSI
jgi:hypothetical protein